jgi:hypothetical protein
VTVARRNDECEKVKDRLVYKLVDLTEEEIKLVEAGV